MEEILISCNELCVDDCGGGSNPKIVLPHLSCSSSGAQSPLRMFAKAVSIDLSVPIENGYIIDVDLWDLTQESVEFFPPCVAPAELQGKRE